MRTALLDLVLPVRCAGCASESVPWCQQCAAQVSRVRWRAGFETVPRPRPLGFPRTWAVAAYDGPVRSAVVAHKDGGRADLRAMLATWWRDAVAAAVAQDPMLCTSLRRGRPVLVVPAPSSAAARRARGADPWLDVTQHALGGRLDLPVRPVLRQARPAADQAGLDAAGRWGNLHGAMRVSRGARLAGAVCLLSDDVVTTGSTLSEAARALRAAGAVHVVAAVLAATQRRVSQP